VSPLEPYRDVASIDCARALELLDRTLSDELDDVELVEVEAHLARCAQCSAELGERRRARDLVRGAVSRSVVPSDLAAGVRARRRAVGRATVPRFALAPRWLYAAAAVLLVAAGTWLLLRREPYRPAIAANLTASEAQIAHVLSVGLVDHVECAIRRGHAGDELGRERILRELDEEYAGLADVVRASAPGYRLTLGHHCAFGGREYVHLILRRGAAFVSLSITERRSGDSLPDASHAATSVGGLPLYASRIDGYDVAGYRSGRWLVFATSSMAPGPHLALLASLSRPVSAFLGGVPARAAAPFGPPRPVVHLCASTFRFSS
jgi:hypothetical protein